MVKFRLKLQILYWSDDHLYSLPNFMNNEITLEKLRPLLESPFYGFYLSQISINNNIVCFTVEDNQQLIRNFPIINDKKLSYDENIKNHLIQIFTDNYKYDTWMEGNMYYQFSSGDYELDFNLLDIQQLVATKSL